MKKLLCSKVYRDAQELTDKLGYKKFKLASVSAAVTILVCTAVSPTFASDIEIYVKPDASIGSGVVVMMLDTSGSMDSTNSNVGTSACDLPSNVQSSGFGTDVAPGGYSRQYCQVGGEKEYLYYKYVAGYQTYWANCYKRRGEVRCDDWRNSAPNISDPELITEGNKNETWFYKINGTVTKYYDRISKLKDALYTLAMTPIYNESTEEGKKGIKKDVKIGIGTFPYGADNKKGYIRIPADKWGDIGSAQRLAVLNLIKSSAFKGQGGTPTSAAYAEAAAYLLGTTTGGGNYSGISESAAVNRALVSGSNYVSPLDKSADAAECSGQGIYFLTDGQPQSPRDTNTTVLMKNALRLSDNYIISNGLNPSGAANEGVWLGSEYAKSDWAAIGSFAKSLRDVNVIKTALGVQEAKREVLTAVVGFGSVFDGKYGDMNSDAKNAYDWGRLKEDGGGSYGLGGFVAAKESEQIVKSLNDFISQVGGSIPSISTGSSTIPKDALNPDVVQGFSYFPQFEPKVADEDRQQIWFGNLKKYYVLNNSVYASENGGSSNVVTSKGVVRDLSDKWAKSGLAYTPKTPIYQKGGALSSLILGTTVTKGEKGNDIIVGRNLLTDYEFDSAKAADLKEGVNYNLLRIDHRYTTADKTKSDTKYARALMAVLGYNINSAENTNGLDLSNREATIRQIGSILHSQPVLLTQEGQLVAKNKDKDGKTVPVYIDSVSREDYVLFGTTQGMLHVVNADTGNEKFTFLPKEMLKKQTETLMLGGGNLAAGKNALYYGMDGEWVAHSVYVSKDDGTLTVRGTTRKIVGEEDKKENLSGKQWVYGGLRMGGRSYYALDLTDLDNPKIKFHIDPETGKVYSLKNPTGKEFKAITNMGQSWSKPKIDYVNWKGERKLVMFVGGGYDAGGSNGDGLFDANGIRTGYAGYENFSYKQEDTTYINKTIGSGVYMFDADTGDLLWHAGSDNTADLVNSDLKYSVSSEIKTVDRNNDGVVDHLYFGDLAGQAFRVDFKNDGASTFTSQINKILTLHKTDGKSPRFYFPPTFTAHKSAGLEEGGNIVVATFISGNKSSPLLATSDSPISTGQKTSTDLAYDAVYAVYDYDIFPDGSNFPISTKETSLISTRVLATSATAKNNELKLITATTSANSNTGAAVSRDTGWGGWYYRFDKGIPIKNGTVTTVGTRNAGVVKGLTPLVAIDGSLYTTMYDASETGTTSKCGAGVKGKSFTKRLCLPTGVCKEDADYTYDLGAGVISLNIGPTTSLGGRTIIVPNPEEVCNGAGCSPCVGTACEAGKNFLSVDGVMRFIPNRWYERYAKAE